MTSKYISNVYQPENTIFNALRNQPDLSQLFKYASESAAEDFSKFLKDNKNNFTLFAPNDEAFANANSSGTLSDFESDLLSSLNYLLVEEVIDLNKLGNTSSKETVGDGIMLSIERIYVGGNPVFSIGGEANVTDPNGIFFCWK